jgi:hypothetical protein
MCHIKTADEASNFIGCVFTGRFYEPKRTLSVTAAAFSIALIAAFEPQGQARNQRWNRQHIEDGRQTQVVRENQ